jgi:hypothetical protein
MSHLFSYMPRLLLAGWSLESPLCRIMFAQRKEIEMDPTKC